MSFHERRIIRFRLSCLNTIIIYHRRLAASTHFSITSSTHWNPMKKNHAILIMGRLASNVKYIHQCASATSKLCTIYNNIREALFIANAIPNLHQLGEGHMVVVFDKNVGHKLQIFIFVVNKIITDIIRLMRTYSIYSLR